jgi:hypothetical protein
MSKKSDRDPPLLKGAKTNNDQPPVEEAPREDRYYGSLEGSYQNGLQLDLRARLAVEFIKAGMLARLVPEDPRTRLAEIEGHPDAVTTDEVFYSAARAKRMATFALDLATALLDQSKERGLTKPMPDHSNLGPAERHALERNARAQVYGQMFLQRLAREEAGPGVMAPPPGMRLG